MRLAATLGEARDLTVLTNGPDTFAALQGLAGRHAAAHRRPARPADRQPRRAARLPGRLAARRRHVLRVGRRRRPRHRRARGDPRRGRGQAQPRRRRRARSSLAVDASKLDGSGRRRRRSSGTRSTSSSPSSTPATPASTPTGASPPSSRSPTTPQTVPAASPTTRPSLDCVSNRLTVDVKDGSGRGSVEEAKGRPEVGRERRGCRLAPVDGLVDGPLEHLGRGVRGRC